MTSQEPIKDFEEKIKELKKKKNELVRELKGKEKSEYRKQRARRLIETGALAEKYFEIENLTISEREEVFKMFANFVKANKPNHLKK
uniref:Relaxasome subunit MobC n=1 Tax=Aeromonas sp. Ne-1 TaxID=1675689 RepID=A0A0H4JD17_9GAMM|nr:hypothetical protein [Aeromonas sp. Ne-1]AKO69672.1 hypothetical protein [Aeromonas sp. Ne-1]